MEITRDTLSTRFALALLEAGLLPPDHWTGDIHSTLDRCIHRFIAQHLPATSCFANVTAKYTHHIGGIDCFLNGEAAGSPGIVLITDGNRFVYQLQKRFLALETRHPQLPATCLLVLQHAFWKTVGCFTPESAFYSASAMHWQGEDNEQARLEELRDELEHEEHRAGVRTIKSDAAIIKEFGVLTRSDFEQHLPPWSFDYRRKPLPKAELAALRTRATRPLIDATLALYDFATGKDNALHGIDSGMGDINSELASPIILRAHPKDNVVRLFDDEMNDAFNAGANALDVCAVIPFASLETAPDVRAGFNRFRQLLSVLHQCEQLLHEMAELED